MNGSLPELRLNTRIKPDADKGFDACWNLCRESRFRKGCSMALCHAGTGDPQKMRALPTAEPLKESLLDQPLPDPGWHRRGRGLDTVIVTTRACQPESSSLVRIVHLDRPVTGVVVTSKGFAAASLPRWLGVPTPLVAGTCFMGLLPRIRLERARDRARAGRGSACG